MSEEKAKVVDTKEDWVGVTSETEKKLSDGFGQVLKMAQEAGRRWKEKKNSATKEVLCLGCSKKFKNMAGYKRHISSKSGCDGKKGCKNVSTVKPDSYDRSLTEVPPEAVRMSLSKNSSVINDLSNTNGKKITVIDLVKCPISMLEGMLKKADVSVVKKFASMRFHANNSSRKVMADKILEKK